MSSILPLPLSNRRATAEALVVRSLETRGSSRRTARCTIYAPMPTNVRLIMRSMAGPAGAGIVCVLAEGRQWSGATTSERKTMHWNLQRSLFIYSVSLSLQGVAKE